MKAARKETRVLQGDWFLAELGEGAHQQTTRDEHGQGWQEVQEDVEQTQCKGGTSHGGLLQVVT